METVEATVCGIGTSPIVIKPASMSMDTSGTNDIGGDNGIE